jgi:hypothetical protein
MSKNNNKSLAESKAGTEEALVLSFCFVRDATLHILVAGPAAFMGILTGPRIQFRCRIPLFQPES